MSRKFRVLFKGLTVTQEAFKNEMTRLGAPPDKVDIMLERAPVVLKDGMAGDEAKRYADAVQKAGGRVAVHDYDDADTTTAAQKPLFIAGFENFTVCPECGLEQKKGDRCIRCGFPFKEGEQVQEKEDAPGY